MKLSFSAQSPALAGLGSFQLCLRLPHYLFSEPYVGPCGPSCKVENPAPQAPLQSWANWDQDFEFPRAWWGCGRKI